MSMESVKNPQADTPETSPAASMIAEDNGKPMPAPANPSAEDNKLINFPERERTERLNRDINVKIDAMERQLASLANAFRRSQEMFRSTMDDLRQRLAGIPAETDQKIQVSLEQIEELSERQQNQQQTAQNQQNTLLALSEEQDVIAAKVDVLADQVLDANASLAETKRQAQKALYMVSGALVGVTLAVGALAYFQLNPVAVPPTVATQLSDLGTSIGREDGFAHELQSDIARLRESLASLELTVNHSGDDQQALQAKLAELEQLRSSLGGMQSGLDNLRQRLDEVQRPLIPTDKPVLELHDGQWLAQRGKGHYSIQLVGVFRYPHLVGYVNKYAQALGKQPLAYNVSNHQGRDLYNLFYGDFATFQAAQEALDALPASLQTNNPWIRGMASIQRSTKH